MEMNFKPLKVLVAMAFAAVLAGSLVACGGGGGEAPAPDAASTPGTTP
jgi:hypothetical protein